MGIPATPRDVKGRLKLFADRRCALGQHRM